MRGWLIDPATRQQAARAALTIGRIYRSRRGLSANMVGQLGELAVHQWLTHYRVGHTMESTPSWDIRLDSGLTIDVKTKDRPRSGLTAPRPNWSASVQADMHDRQTPDLYLFCSVHYSHQLPTRVWICGLLPHRDVATTGRLAQKGQPRRGGNGGTYDASCWQIPYSRLQDPARWIASHVETTDPIPAPLPTLQ